MANPITKLAGTAVTWATAATLMSTPAFACDQERGDRCDDQQPTISSGSGSESTAQNRNEIGIGNENTAQNRNEIGIGNESSAQNKNEIGIGVEGGESKSISGSDSRSNSISGLENSGNSASKSTSGIENSGNSASKSTAASNTKVDTNTNTIVSNKTGDSNSKSKSSASGNKTVTNVGGTNVSDNSKTKYYDSIKIPNIALANSLPPLPTTLTYCTTIDQETGWGVSLGVGIAAASGALSFSTPGNSHVKTDTTCLQIIKTGDEAIQQVIVNGRVMEAVAVNPATPCKLRAAAMVQSMNKQQIDTRFGGNYLKALDTYTAFCAPNVVYREAAAANTVPATPAKKFVKKARKPSPCEATRRELKRLKTKLQGQAPQPK